MSNLVFNSGKPEAANPDWVDKAVALIYLKEALAAEDYEGCATLVASAKRCGARTREINRLLAGPPRRVRGRG